jgi:hypothetical protein
LGLVIELNIAQSEVTQICFGNQTVLRLSPTAEMAIEGAFDWVHHGGNPVLIDDPTSALKVAGQLAELVGCSIVCGQISDAVDLTLTFSDGSSIRVRGSSAYEAFDLNLQGSPVKIVGGSQGRLEIWD